MGNYVLTIKDRTKERFREYTGCSRNVISQDEGLNALMDTIDRLREENNKLLIERNSAYTSYQDLHEKYEKLQTEHIELLKSIKTGG